MFAGQVKDSSPRSTKKIFEIIVNNLRQRVHYVALQGRIVWTNDIIDLFTPCGNQTILQDFLIFGCVCMVIQQRYFPDHEIRKEFYGWRREFPAILFFHLPSNYRCTGPFKLSLDFSRNMTLFQPSPLEFRFSFPQPNLFFFLFCQKSLFGRLSSTTYTFIRATQYNSNVYLACVRFLQVLFKVFCKTKTD